MAKKKVKKVKDPNKKSLWQEFKEFINKGNAFMLAVGVVIGGAFNAIVTALVNILMSVATWGVPGGLKGLVTVLPAASAAQRGFNPEIGLGQSFAKGDLQALAEALAKAQYTEAVVNENPNLIESAKATITSNYELHGSLYTYKMSAVIDWGSFINAIIAFLIVALTLFIIVKVTTILAKKREEAKEKLKAKLKGKKGKEDGEEGDEEKPEGEEEPKEEEPAEEEK